MKEDQSPHVLSYSDIDLVALNQLAKDWNVDFLQLGAGKFSGELTQVIHSEFQLARAKFNLAVKQEGYSPEGVWSFAFVNDSPLHWRNYVVEPESIIIYAPGSKINAVSTDNFEVFIFSIPETILFEMAKEKNYSQAIDVIHKTELLKTNHPLWLKLREHIKAAIESHDNPKITNEGLPEDFVQELLKLIESATKSSRKVSNDSRLELLSTMEQYMQKNVTETISVKELSRIHHVSERKLLYTFKKRFGIGPKAYIKILRLNRVYHKLSTSNIDDSISLIARECGFWHMGQFHKDYKSFFGELPSSTKTNADHN